MPSASEALAAPPRVIRSAGARWQAVALRSVALSYGRAGDRAPRPRTGRGPSLDRRTHDEQQS